MMVSNVSKRLDGIDTKKMNVNWLRRNLGVVIQVNGCF